MALIARSLALRGEFVGVIGSDGITPASDWDVATRNGRPVAYRVGIPEAGGGRTETLLAAEVLHVRIGSDPVAPWTGHAPLRGRPSPRTSCTRSRRRCATFTGTRLSALRFFPFPMARPTTWQAMRGAFRGRRGGTLVVEGVAQAVAAGMHPSLGRSPRT